MAPIFAMLSGATRPAQNPGEQERISRIVVADAIVTERPAALFVPRSFGMQAASGELQAGRRSADRAQLDRPRPDVRGASAQFSGLLFAHKTGAGERP